MTLRTSLIITGDSATAKKAVDDLKGSVGQLGDSAKGAAAPLAQVDAAQKDVAASAGRAASAVSALENEERGAAVSARDLAAAQGAIAASAGQTSAQLGTLTSISGKMSASFGAAGVNANQLRVQTGGLAPAAEAAAGGFGGFLQKLLATEAAELVVAEAAGAVAGILTGALTAGIGLAVGALIGLVANLDDTDEAADRAGKSLDAFASRQANIGNFIDITTGKLKEQNQTLIQNAILARRAQIEKTRAEAQATGLGAVNAVRDLVSPRNRAAQAGQYMAFGGRDYGYPEPNKALQQALSAATTPRGINIEELDRQLAKLGGTYADLRKKVSDAAGQVVTSEREANRLETEIRALMGDSTALRSQATDATVKHTAAVRGSAGALRDHTKASNDNNAATRQLEQDLQGVIGRYDPARKAAADYATELERIARLQAAGKITADDADRYRLAAGAVRDQAEAKEAQERFNRIFGDGFGSLETINQKSADEQAAYWRKVANSIDGVNDSARQAQQAKEELASIATGALDAIVVRGEKAGDVIEHLAEMIASAALEATLLGTGPLAGLLGTGGQNGAIGGLLGRVLNGGRGTAPGATSTETKVIADAIGKQTGKEVGKELERSLGAQGTLGRVLKNAGLGYAAGSATGSGLGGALGGAIGGELASKFLTKALGSFAGPLGSIAGGLLGGVIGGLFKPKAKPGGATVSNVDGQAAMSGTVGSDRKAIQAGTGLAGSVAATINQIVDQLGGTLGNFSVQIGKYKDDLRVNVNGRPLGGVKGSGAMGFGSDENAAVNAAVALAIGQGAIKGVSDAVAKALRSSKDVDQALKEALKVQEVETLLGGIGGQMEKAFRDFEATAKERVRIAQQYGFDVVAIEKRNAEDRAKIADDLLKSQVGSLQQLVDEMTHGSLFEGTALDKIKALNTEIAKAQADLDAGKEGAGDTLANLYGQLNDSLKAAYGTTGGFATGRDDILNQAQAAIAKANAQIAAAQAKVSDPALATTNAALDENNDQNAKIISALQYNNDILKQIAAYNSSKFNLNELAAV